MCNLLHVPPLSADPQQAPSAGKPAAPTAGSQTSQSDQKLNLSDELIQQVLEPLRAGMETQNIRQVMSVFDKGELSGYGDLEQELHAFFQQYNEVRFRYQILQAESTNDRATATAEIDMDALPYSVSQIISRRSAQMHLQLKLEPKGWKVTRFSPSDFFDVDYTAR